MLGLEHDALLVLGDADEFVEPLAAIGSCGIGVKSVLPRQHQPIRGGIVEELLAGCGLDTVLDRGLEGLVDAARWHVHRLCLAAREPGEIGEQVFLLLEIAVGILDIGLRHIPQELPRVGSALGLVCDQGGHQWISGGVEARERELRVIKRHILCQERGVTELQKAPTRLLGQVEDDLVADVGQTGAAVDHDRRPERCNVVAGRHDRPAGIRGVVDREGDNTAHVGDRVERQAVHLARADIFAEGILLDGIAFDGGIKNVGAGRETLHDLEHRPAHDDGVAARPGLDDKVAHGAHVGAVEIDRVVAAAGEDLQPLDVLECLHLHAGAVDPLHRPAVDDLRVDIERVGQHRADDADGVKPAPAVDIDIGILHIDKTVDVDVTGIFRGVGRQALAALFAERAA